MAEQEVEEVEVVEQEVPQLVPDDLVLITQVIQAAQGRGAIQADEMIAVGTVYGKLTAILNALSEQQQK